MIKIELEKQLIKYGIKETFDNEESFYKWCEPLNTLEINNLMSLDIDPVEIPFPKYLLINKELLNTSDYNKKVHALSQVKNAEGWYHLYPNIFNVEFLESENFYKDIEMMSRAKTAQYCLWVLGKSEFIYSPYHEEDLRLIVETSDIDGLTEKGYDLSFVVWDVLATTAMNIDSIKSPYHEQDMKMLANAGSSKLQTSHSYPEKTITHLANNTLSLKSENHLQNMELLLNNIDIGAFLYAVMTDSDFVNSKYYYRLINEMIEYHDNINCVILLCIYAIGIEKTHLCIFGHNREFNNLANRNDLSNLLENVKYKLDIIDSEYSIYEVNYIEAEETNKNKIFSKVRKIFKQQ